MILNLVLLAIAFVAGAVFGVMNTATVSNAITVIDGAEKKAQALLAQITAHKAQ